MTRIIHFHLLLGAVLGKYVVNQFELEPCPIHTSKTTKIYMHHLLLDLSKKEFILPNADSLIVAWYSRIGKGVGDIINLTLSKSPFTILGHPHSGHSKSNPLRTCGWSL